MDLKTYFGKNILLKEHDMLLIFNNPNFSSEQYMINLLVILAKFYIHTMSFFKKWPSFITFKKTDLNIYLQTLSHLKTHKNNQNY